MALFFSALPAAGTFSAPFSAGNSSAPFAAGRTAVFSASTEHVEPCSTTDTRPAQQVRSAVFCSWPAGMHDEAIARQTPSPACSSADAKAPEKGGDSKRASAATQRLGTHRGRAPVSRLPVPLRPGATGGKAPGCGGTAPFWAAPPAPQPHASGAWGGAASWSQRSRGLPGTGTPRSFQAAGQGCCSRQRCGRCALGTV